MINSWKNKYELPWMKPISHEEFIQASTGELGIKVTLNRNIPKKYFQGIKGKKVLGIGAGGGQQMAILSALGAQCTLLDLSKEQLEKDKEVATREHFTIDLVEGDMSKTFPFLDESFDFVINPISIQYINQLDTFFSEIGRVLEKEGLFFGGFMKDFLYSLDEEDVKLVGKLPYNPIENKELQVIVEKEDLGYQFSHSLEEIIGGEIKNNLELKEIYEDYLLIGNTAEKNIPTFFATICQKK